MLVAVKTPRISIQMRGAIPKKYIALLKVDFGSKVRIEPEDDAYIDVFSTDWYSAESAATTPGTTLRFYRRLHKLTQRALGGRLGCPAQTVSNMENSLRPISRRMAYKLARVFTVPAGRFI
jgi:DNA-binding XRE family transcriptional regulator